MVKQKKISAKDLFKVTPEEERLIEKKFKNLGPVIRYEGSVMDFLKD